MLHNDQFFPPLPSGTKITVDEELNTQSMNPIANKPVAEAVEDLNDRVDDISAIGRFLSYWNSATGLPATNPTTLPYTYKTGDYFVVGTVASSGGTNYKPDGTSYTGTASTTAETGEVLTQDIYRFDGTSWTLAQNTNPDLSGYVPVFQRTFTTAEKLQARQNIEAQQTISDLETIRTGAEAGSTAYQKPSGGIPATDMTSVVQTSLEKADTALQEHQSLAAYRTAAQQDVIDGGKADKVASPTAGNFAGLDANGNLTDSGKKASDFLQEHQSLAAYRTSAAQDVIDATKQDTLISAGAAAGQFVRVKTVDATGKPTEYEPVALYRTITVTCVTQDGVTVTGQLVTVREGGPTGKVYATAAYNGQPVSFTALPGFVYHISVSNTLAGHFNPTTSTGIVQDANIAVTLTYSDYSSIHTFMDIQAALNEDIDLSGLVGESVTADWNGLTLTWDVGDYDSVNKEIGLLLHDTLPDQMQYEPQQAMTWFEDGLAAGDYKFTHSGVDYYLHIALAIPAGGQLRATTTTFSVFASITATTAQENGNVSTTEIAGAVSLGTTATGNLNHMDRINYGSNNAKESGLFEWLNSTQGPNEALTGRPCKFSRPYNTGSRGGFLYGLDPEALSCIADTTADYRTNNVYEAPAAMGGTTVKGTTYSMTSKIFLISNAEVGLEGSNPWGLFVGATNPDRIKRYNGTARGWWTRVPYPNNANLECGVYTTGGLNYNNANNSHGVVPACKIKKSI